MKLLAPDVTFWSDGGGQVTAALKPLRGAMKVARFLLAIQRKSLSAIGADLANINGQPSIVLRTGSDSHSVMTFKIVDGYIQTIYCIRNPEKLKQLNQSVMSGNYG